MATLLDPITITPDPAEETPVVPEAAQGLTLDSPIPQQDEGLTLAPNDSPLPPSQATADKRTSRIQYGLRDTLKLPDDIVREQISTGNEYELRSRAAMEMDYQNSIKKQNRIRELASAKGGPLTPEEVSTVLDPILPSNQTVDPKDVVERAWAHTWNSSIDTATQYMENNVWDQAQKEIPQRASQLRAKADDFTAKMLIARNLKDEVDEEYKDQSWLGWGVDQAKMLFQPYTEMKLRGRNSDVGFTDGVLLGANLKRQADNLFSSTSTPAEFRERLHEAVDKLRQDNPTLAKQYMSYVVGNSSLEQSLDSVFTTLAPVDLIGVGQIGRALAKKIYLNNKATKMFKDMTKAAAEAADSDAVSKTITPEAAASEAKGDIVAAGVKRAATKTDQELKGALDVTESIKDDFFTYFKGIGGELTNDIGSASREQAVRLQNGFYNTANGLWDALNRVVRPSRTPNALTTEDAFKAYREEQIRNFKGIDNQLSNIGEPVPERVTNTHWVPYTIHNVDGALFKTPEQALANAELNGFKGVKVVDDIGPVVSKESYYDGPKIDIRRKPQLERTLDDLPGVIEKYKNDLKAATDKEVAKSIRADIKSMKQLQKQYVQDLAEINSRLTKVPAEIVQNGNGYSIRLWRPYVETSDIVRSFAISDNRGNIVKEAASPLRSDLGNENTRTWLKGYLGWFRGADDTLSLYDTLNRKAATTAQNVINELLSEEARKIEAVYTGMIREDAITGIKPPWWQAKARAFLGKISQKQVASEFDQTLDYARKALNPVTDKPGYFFKTIGELEGYYQNAFKRLPTPAETEAYFTHVKLVEANRVFSEISEFRNRARLGTEQHNIYMLSKSGERTESGYFDGIKQNNYPGGTKGQVLVMDNDPTKQRLYPVQRNDAFTKKIKEAVEKGEMQVIRVYDPDSYPLKDISDVAGYNRVRWVVTKNVDTKPLDFKHVARQEGGHFDYDYDFYIKQAQMVHDQGGPAGIVKSNELTSWYVGDTTVMPMKNRALARKVAKHLEEVRRLIKDGKLDEAKAYTEQNLPMDWDNGKDGVLNWFKETRDDKGRIMPSRLSLNEPIQVVGRNQTIYGLDKELQNRYSSFQDAFQSGSDAKAWKVAYNQERDVDNLRTINDIGTKNNPLYNWEPAEMVDPTVTMNRALQRAVRSTFMDDYKISSVEHWLSEAAPFLKLKDTELFASPFYHFNTVTDKSAFKPDAPRWLVDNLLMNRQKIRQFTGMQSQFDTYVHGIAQNWADKFYESYGPEANRQGLEKLTLLPMWLIARTDDPVQALRSYAFNAKLGLFNPVQLLVQANTHVNILSLEPRAGSAGTWAQMLHQVSRANANPKMLDYLDDLATKFNVLGVKFKPGEWKEARQMLIDSGWDRVAGEVSFRDDQLAYRFIKNDLNNFLDAGQLFFREGEKSPRISAYYASYRKYRDAHPTGAISDLDKRKILNYADLLTNNMTRASASNLEKGVFSLSSQFLTFQMRAMELFTGQRLGETLPQRTLARARLLTGYSAFYGVPSALGVTGWPFGDSLKQAALDRGYVVGDNWLNSMIMEGLPALTGAIITGKGDPQAGNWYNFGPRFGSQGMTQIRDALQADNAFMSVLTGAGGSTFYNTIKNVGSPLWLSLMSLYNPTAEGAKYTPSFSDLASAALGEISSFQNFNRLKYALNTGRWINNNDVYIDDISKANAIFQSLTGLSSQDQSDNFLRGKIGNAVKDDIKEVQKKVNKMYFQLQTAIENNDPSEEKRIGTNINSLMILEGIPPQQRTKIISIAVGNYQSQIDRSQEQFANPDFTPLDKQETHEDAFRRQLILKNKRTSK